MSLAGFEEWRPYKGSLATFLSEYKCPYQGDIIQLKSTPQHCYEILISGCCDLVQDKADFLTFVGALPVSLFLKKLYIAKRNKDQKKQKNNKDQFSTEINYTLDNINKDDFDKYIATPSFKGDVKIYFENKNERYIFLPHQQDIFDTNIIIDLQNIKSIPINNIEDAPLNECIDGKDKIISLFARLDYRYRDFILQKLSFYTARIALPNYKKINPKDETGFYSELFGRVIDNFE